MKKQLIWVFEWRKSVHYRWSYILFSPECKELTSMLDPLLYRRGVPPVVIRCVHWTMQMGVLQTWIKAQGIAVVMNSDCKSGCFQTSWNPTNKMSYWILSIETGPRWHATTLSLCINSCNPYNTTPQWVKPILLLMLFSFQLQCFVHVHTCICILNCTVNKSMISWKEDLWFFLLWSIIKSALNKNSSMTDENRLADHYEKIRWALLVRIDWAVLMRIEWEL